VVLWAGQVRRAGLASAAMAGPQETWRVTTTWIRRSRARAGRPGLLAGQPVVLAGLDLGIGEPGADIPPVTQREVPPHRRDRAGRAKRCCRGTGWLALG
jgi:hypothetical protein